MSIFSGLRRGSTMSTSDTATVRLVSGWCLQYPDSGLYERVPLLGSALDEAAPSRPRRRLAGFIDHLSRTTPHQAAVHYVDVFDLRSRRSLYLCGHLDRSLRRTALTKIIESYQANGLNLAEETPDFLPAVLELSTVDIAAADDVLQSMRSSIVSLYGAVRAVKSRYADVLAAVLDTVDT